jgi:hypothetical protein
MVFGLVCAAGALSCTENSETQEIVDHLTKAGFAAEDIMVADGVVYVGRDAVVTLAASREMVGGGGSGKEQYHTNNLISTTLTKICVNGSTFTGVFSTALDLAIQNYDEQPLTFAMARTPSAGCSFTINAVIQPGLVGGVSGFPSGGLPFATINIGDGMAAFSVDTIEHVITHEIGHTIGFRHTDFFNRTISCGTGGNEGDAGVGVTLVPDTPSGAVVGGSIMNSCFRSAETGEFTATDLVALKRLYGVERAANPCTVAGDGLYCGSSTQGGFGGGPGNELFACVGHSTVAGTPCRTSCSQQPAGVPDRCNPDPCAAIFGGNNGAYCGRSTQSGFDSSSASAYAVYTCSNGRTIATQFCPRGCNLAPPGTPDRCN